jgi:hypothetical protein
MTTDTRTIHAAFIPVRMTDPVKVVPVSRDLSDLYSLIGCEMVERVSFPPAIVSRVSIEMWVDEEGALKADRVMNIRASIIAGRVIFGNAILSGESNDSGLTTLYLDCPKSFIDRVEILAKMWIADPDMRRRWEHGS